MIKACLSKSPFGTKEAISTKVLNPMSSHLSALRVAVIFFVSAVALGSQFDSLAAETPGEIRIVEVEGKVELLTFGSTNWVTTQTNQPVYPLARLRVGPNSRAALLWSDKSVIRFSALTELEILPPPDPQ